MFCSNCGKEATGKFCSHCGEMLNVETSIKEINVGCDCNIENHKYCEDDNLHNAEDTYISINECEINMSQIIREYGENKSDAIKYFMDETGTSLDESRNLINEAYKELFILEPKKSFWDSVKEESSKQREKELKKRQQEVERIKQMDREGVAYCPKCHSTSLSADKKGFGVGKAVVGGFLLGPIGLVAGNAGAKKIRVTCMQCGKQFWAGKR